jgi:hypothetical protein
VTPYFFLKYWATEIFLERSSGSGKVAVEASLSTNSSMVLELEVSIRLPWIRKAELLPLCRFLGMGGRYSNLLELTEVLLEHRTFPVAKSGLVHGRKLRRAAVEDLADGASELLSTPEGTVGDVDVDRQGFVELIIQDGTERGKYTLESLNTAAKVEANLSALEEGLLDLGVLLRRPLAHDVIEEVDSVDAFGGPRGLTVEERVQTNEVNLACPADMNGMLVATRTWLGRTAFLFVEIDSDTSIVTRQALAGPCQLVGVPDPEVVGLTKLRFDTSGVPDFLQQDALGVVESITAVVELGEVSTKLRLREKKTYIILVDHCIGSFDDVEGIEHDVGSLSELVEVFWALRKRTRNGDLVIVSKNKVVVPRGVKGSILVETTGRSFLANHDEYGKRREWKTIDV